MSLPTRGAWIEIKQVIADVVLPRRSLPTRGAWIEIRPHRQGRAYASSLPTRGAWIEIIPAATGWRLDNVAPHTGSVD